MRYARIAVIYLFLFTFLVSPAVGAFSLEDEKKIGRETYNELEKNNALLKTKKVVDYLNAVGQKILAQADNKQPFDYQFNIIKSASINAFATPGGYVYIHRGLINLAENEAQLASVIAHELGHVNLRHIADAIEKSKKINLATLAGILAGALLGGSPELAAGVMSMSVAGGAHMSLKYSREHEEEADRMGMYYLVRAGYDPSAMVDFLKVMKRQELYSGLVPSYFLTHPGTEDRISYLDSLIKTVYRTPGKTELIGNFKRIQTILLIISSRDQEANRRHFEENLKKNPESVDDLYGLAVTEAKLGRFDRALSLFEKARALAPQDPDILGDQGITYFLAGKTKEALKPLSEAISRGSEDPEAYVFLAKTYDALGNTAKALEQLKLLEKKKLGDEEDLYYNMASLYGKLGDEISSHYYFGLYFKKKNRADSALYHFRAAREKIKPGDERIRDIEREIQSLGKDKRSNPPSPGRTVP
ncbi:MAG TPA: M48 family metalloprotease [Syntrophales bacterium]|nr:M48 family metalloprotease [Syntrophales bacterium]HOL59234.1 M48 family metalloprotease [Syntrophales bacterium]HPO35284.1 M48 family metalloprotease [Syntrophales bacterium]